LKTALVRQAPAWCARWVAPFIPALVLPAAAFAQAPYGQPYTDPYRAGPTRPLDGSPRSGVYSAQPAPSYQQAPRADAAPRGLGSAAAPADAPAIWRGLYVGLQGGHRWTNTEATGSGLAALSTRGAQFGGHVGTNYQTGNLVYGLEADLMVGNASASTSSLGTTFALKDSWTSTLRARAGYSFGPALLYATGGIAVAGQDLTLKTSTLSAALNDARIGLVLGAGLEMQLTQQLSARIEGLHYSYKDQALNLGVVNQSVKQDSNVIRAGVSYRFN
jgi:outer membrane immunogenic protein